MCMLWSSLPSRLQSTIDPTFLPPPTSIPLKDSIQCHFKMHEEDLPIPTEDLPILMEDKKLAIRSQMLEIEVRSQSWCTTQYKLLLEEICKCTVDRDVSATDLNLPPVSLRGPQQAATTPAQPLSMTMVVTQPGSSSVVKVEAGGGSQVGDDKSGVARRVRRHRLGKKEEE